MTDLTEKVVVSASAAKSGPLNISPSIDQGAASCPRVDVLGVRFHAMRLGETLDLFDLFVRQRMPRQIFFSNAHTLALCRVNQNFLRLINNADLNLADGMSIVWGARLLGIQIPERVPGPDLMLKLCERAAEKGYRVFLMGTSDKNLLNLNAALVKKFPNLQITGMYSPPIRDRFSEEDTSLMLAKINAGKPDILFVGISCPKQELWISENLHRLNVPVSLGVGAAFDFLSGLIPRAPEWLRNRGLEWLYRLWREPRRLWRRYLLGNFVFLSLLVKERIKLHFLG
jgi:N-acetylglucosaminyldiphosphoundecaprenol N-acetyl-beta-D-mannosaminyltransferase